MLIAMMGEPLEEDERAVFKALTGREREPLERVEGFWGDSSAVEAERAAPWPS